MTEWDIGGGAVAMLLAGGVWAISGIFTTIMWIAVMGLCLATVGFVLFGFSPTESDDMAKTASDLGGNDK